MKKRGYFFYLLFMLGLAAIIYGDARRVLLERPARPTAEQLEAALADAARMEERTAPFHHWVGFSQSGRLAGAAFVTTELPPETRGYVGPVPVLVGMTPKGVITRLIVLRNRETPYYMRMIIRSGLFRKIAGQSISEKWSNIDAVSGATISSSAIIRDVFTAAELAAVQLFHIDVSAHRGAGERGFKRFLPVLALAFSLGLGLSAGFMRRNRRLKWVSFMAGIGVVGIYLSVPLSFSHICSLLAGDIPTWSNPRLLVMLVFVLITTLAWGPVYCGHICPFGALQEIAYRAAPDFKIRASGALLKRLRDLRWLLLFLLVILVFGANIAEAAGAEPYPYLFDELHRLVFGGQSSHAALLRGAIWGFAAVAIAMSAGVKRFWCRFFCPTGACLLLLSRHRARSGIRSGIEV